MKKIAVSILSACLLMSAASAVSAAPSRMLLLNEYSEQLTVII
ncbi:MULTISPECIES: hypothetical protein [unclassified Paenibacillus]|nr:MULTISPECIES: hypothetical protein [unclassified Paenibacillus]MDF9842629.1 opacity protein-like surface antigen [Paenibacillus sp. PastF-2]MDF9849164.1 opacity protein-like surface antigen [Paenibacillus sp. PastM-2]MDF9855790.1 opacity protein-like surface antigen [Paenibacillus sp. PastF-1]MDH6481006.1 opacity protein-like surface antigen [Paenibacillus sp. PastH-2]MDH6508481.1 opacity protein-like surface antigen [Paenibacillus sp. PastM-3]